MSRPARLLLVLLAGLLLLGAVGALIWSLPPIPADAQGVGFFGTSPTGTRTACTAITNPVIGQSFCFDRVSNSLFAWDGNNWNQIGFTPNGIATVSGALVLTGAANQSAITLNVFSTSTTTSTIVSRATGFYAGQFFNITDAGTDLANANNIGLVGQSVYSNAGYFQQGGAPGSPGATLTSNNVYPGLYVTRVVGNLNGFNYTQPVFRIDDTTTSTGILMDAKRNGAVVMGLGSDGTAFFGAASNGMTGGYDFRPTSVNAGFLIDNQVVTTDGASVPLWLAGKTGAGNIGNVSLEAAVNTATTMPDMVFRTGSNTSSGFGTERLRLGVVGGVQLGAPASGDKGIGTLNVATAVYLNGTQTLFNGAPNGAVRCTNNCGLSPSIVGTNSAMRVTMGATGTPATPFLVLFSGTWTATPSCIAQIDTPGTTAATVTRANASTTGVQVNTVVNPPNSAVYSIHCLGVG